MFELTQSVGEDGGGIISSFTLACNMQLWSRLMKIWIQLQHSAMLRAVRRHELLHEC